MKTVPDLHHYRIAIVIGVDHTLQHFIPELAPNDPRTKLRLRFLDFLRDITGRYAVDLICEEAKHGAESIAEMVSDRERIRYRNIEMSKQRRAELGIPLLHTIDMPGSEFPPEQKTNWNSLRESHMVDELLGAVGGARVLIVVCGVSHMPVFVQALQSKFARVEPYDVTTLGWFDKTLL